MSMKAYLLFQHCEDDLFLAFRIICALKDYGLPLKASRFDFNSPPPKNIIVDLFKNNNLLGIIQLVSKNNIHSQTLYEKISDYYTEKIPVFVLIVDDIDVTDLGFLPDNDSPIYLNYGIATLEAEIPKITRIISGSNSNLEMVTISDKHKYLNHLITKLESQFGLIEELCTSLNSRPHYIETWENPVRFSLYSQLGEHLEDYTSASDVLRDHKRFLLVGDISSGKTTMMYQLMLQQARNYQEAQADSQDSPIFPIHLPLQSGTIPLSEESFNFKQIMADYLSRSFDDMAPILAGLETGDAMLWIDLNSDNPALMATINSWMQSDDAPKNIVLCPGNGSSHLFAAKALDIPVLKINPLHINHVHQFANHYLGKRARFLTDMLFADGHPSNHYAKVRVNDLTHLALIAHQYVMDDISLNNAEHLSSMMEAFVQHRWDTYYATENQKQQPELSYSDFLATLRHLALTMLLNDRVGVLPDEIVEQRFEVTDTIQVASRMGLIYVDEYGLEFSPNELLYYFGGQALALDLLKTRTALPQFTSRGEFIQTAWDRAVKYYLAYTAQFDEAIHILIATNPYLALQIVDRYRDNDDILERVILSIITMESVPSHTTINCLMRHDQTQLNGILLRMARDASWHIRLRATYIIKAICSSELQGIMEILDKGVNDRTVVALKLLQDDVVPTLLCLLDDPDYQLLAVRTLGQLHDKAGVPLIVEYLNIRPRVTDKSLWMAECISALGHIADEDALDQLVTLLGHGKKYIQVRAVDAIVQHGQLGLERLITLTTHSDATTRYFAVLGLNNFDDPSAIEARIKTIYDSDADIRAISISGLAHTQDEDALVAVMKHISDNEIAQRIHKSVAVVARQAAEAMGVAVKELKPRKLSDARIQHIAKRTIVAQKRAATSATKAKDRLTRDTTEAKIVNVHIEDDLVHRNQDELIDQLNSSNVDLRLEAIRALSRDMNNEVLYRIIQRVVDSNLLVSEFALRVIMQVKPKALLILMRMLQGDLKAKCTALNVSKVVNDPSLIPALTACLELTVECRVGREQGRVCDMAAQCLISIGTEEALEVVSAWYKQRFVTHASTHHVDKQVRLDEVPATSDNGDEPVNYNETFASLLTKIRVAPWEDKQIATRALHAHAKSLSANAPDGVVDLLIDTIDDPDWHIRWVACEAIAWLKNKRCLQTLVACLDDEHWNVRLTAIGGLVELDDIASAQAIENVLTDENAQVREMAAEALGVLGGARNVPALINVIMTDDDDIVKLVAISSLGNIPTGDGVAKLLDLMQESKVEVRWTAARSLSQVAKHAHVDELIPYLQDKSLPEWDDNRVCDWIQLGLERIGTKEALHAVKQWRLSLH